MATIKDMKNIKIGDKIKTDYFPIERSIVRLVVAVEHNCNSQTGTMISVDGGKICPNCGLQGTAIDNIDIVWVRWFKSVDNTNN
jgi:hypothetical protein